MAIRTARFFETTSGNGFVLAIGLLACFVLPQGASAQSTLMSTIHQDGIAASLVAEDAQSVAVSWRFLRPLETPLTDMVATFNGRPLGVPLIAPYPEPGDRTGIFYLIDTSAVERADQIQKDKVFLLTLAGKAESHQQIAIGTYDDKPRMLLPEDRDALSVVTMLAASEPKAVPANLGDALAFASLLLMQMPVDRRGVVVFTDGYSDDGVNAELLLARAKAANIIYHFVITGSHRSANLDVLKQLADASGGQIVASERRDDFTNAQFALLDSGGVARFPLVGVKRMPWEADSNVEVVINYGAQSLRLSLDIVVPVASIGEGTAHIVQMRTAQIAGAGLALVIGLGATLLFRRKQRSSSLVPQQHSAAAVASEPISAHLTTLEDVEMGTVYPITKPLVLIGRNGENDIVLNDPSVGRFHAVVQQVGDQQYSIVDQASANGTMVNNKRVDSSMLAEGDLVALGSKIMRFHRSFR